MVMLVRPSISFSMPSCIRASVLASTLEVASSRTRIFGSITSALANESSCLCPSERVVPLWLTGSSYLSGSRSMNFDAFTVCAASMTFSRLISLYRRIFVSMSPWKRNTSCLTVPTAFLNSFMFILLSGTPSIRIWPF